MWPTMGTINKRPEATVKIKSCRDFVDGFPSFLLVGFDDVGNRGEVQTHTESWKKTLKHSLFYFHLESECSDCGCRCQVQPV